MGVPGLRCRQGGVCERERAVGGLSPAIPVASESESEYQLADMGGTVYDLAVIGSGPAGEKAALEASSLGARVVVIERECSPGGASVLTGTIPSKSLRETVQYIGSLSQSEISGIDPHLRRKVTVKELMHRKNRVVADRVRKTLEAYKNNGIEYIRGSARFLRPDSIAVRRTDSGEPLRIQTRKSIIAVGTRPYHPPDIPFDHTTILDSDSILALQRIPEEMCVYGGGVIGCEYASIFAKLGTEVHLIDPRGRLLDFIDCDLSTKLVELMKESGIVLHLGDRYKRIATENGRVRIDLASGRRYDFPILLYANGRQGLAGGLSLENCGISLNRKSQLDVNQNYQTSVPTIYAAGDIIGFPSLVSVANEEGRLAALHAVSGRSVQRFGSDIPSAIYTIPEIATVGPGEEECRKRGIPCLTGVCHFRDLARGYMIGERNGLLKLVFRRDTLELISVHILGQSAAELIHIGQAVIGHRGKIDYFIDTVFNFPTLSLAYKVAARNGICKLDDSRRTISAHHCKS